MRAPPSFMLTRIYREAHPLCRAVVFGAVTAFLILATAFSHLAVSRTRAGFPDAAEKYYLPPRPVLRAASLGYNEALADLIWVKTVLYFGERVTGNRKYQYLHRYLDAVIALDPHFKRVYLWAGSVAMYNMNRITQESVWRSIRYLEKGHRVFPKDWEILFALASNYLYELRTDDPQKQARWRKIGADYLWKAANIGQGPPYLHSLAAKVWSESGRWETIYTRLQQVYASTNNPQVRKSVRRRMAELLLYGADQVLTVERIAALLSLATGRGGLTAPLSVLFAQTFAARARETKREKLTGVDAVQKSYDRLEKAWKRELPYVPLDLYILLRRNRGDASVSEHSNGKKRAHQIPTGTSPRPAGTSPRPD
jgi:hypothetical protein